MFAADHSDDATLQFIYHSALCECFPRASVQVSQSSHWQSSFPWEVKPPQTTGQTFKGQTGPCLQWERREMCCLHPGADSHSTSRTSKHEQNVVKIRRQEKYYYCPFRDEAPRHEEIQWAALLQICAVQELAIKHRIHRYCHFTDGKTKSQNNSGLLKVVQGIYSKPRTWIWSCWILVSIFPKGIVDKEINVNNFPQSCRVSVREERLFQKNMPLVLEKEA